MHSKKYVLSHLCTLGQVICIQSPELFMHWELCCCTYQRYLTDFCGLMLQLHVEMMVSSL